MNLKALKALGLFVLITGGVVSGIWIAEWAFTYRAALERAERLRAQNCRDAMSDPEYFGDLTEALIAKCKKEVF